MTFHIHTRIKMLRSIIAKDTTFIALLHQHNYRFIDDDIPRTFHDLLIGSQVKKFSGRSSSDISWRPILDGSLLTENSEVFLNKVQLIRKTVQTD
jgi:hypothetical protein